jgi:hypothetical protein
MNDRLYLTADAAGGDPDSAWRRVDIRTDEGIASPLPSISATCNAMSFDCGLNPQNPSKLAAQGGIHFRGPTTMTRRLMARGDAAWIARLRQDIGFPIGEFTGSDAFYAVRTQGGFDVSLVMEARFAPSIGAALAQVSTQWWLRVPSSTPDRLYLSADLSGADPEAGWRTHDMRYDDGARPTPAMTALQTAITNDVDVDGRDPRIWNAWGGLSFTGEDIASEQRSPRRYAKRTVNGVSKHISVVTSAQSIGAWLIEQLAQRALAETSTSRISRFT